MDMEKRWNGGLPWASVAVLTALCGFLAVLQYRWIGEISGAERRQLQEALSDRLEDVRRDFSQQLSNASRALQPAPAEVDRLGSEGAFTAQYLQWKTRSEPWFRRIGLAVRRGDEVGFHGLNLETGQFSTAPWPSEWTGIESRLERRGRGEPGAFFQEEEPIVLELPQFGPEGREQEWLLLEPDPGFLQRRVLPDLLARDLGSNGKLEYVVEVVSSGNPSAVIYRSPANGSPIAESADGSIPLFDPRLLNPPRQARKGPPGEPFRRGGRPGFGGPGPPPGLPGGVPAGWLLRVRHQAGSLEALVAQTRRRDLAVSAGILILILITVSLLIHLSRRAQQLAELQINFVAGVSHELRTPLTVIRTAAYNLRGKLAQQPRQVEQYSHLIQQESEKLGALVEQILRFARAKAGYVIHRREPVSLESLIDRSIQMSGAGLDAANVVLEKKVEPGLPTVFADEEALSSALHNLLENAIKYGAATTPWIGIFASAVSGETGAAIEISVVDRGPGIARDEQKRIFDPFFRGKRALTDQVHGTGLGLDLARRIVEAHGGTIRVESTPKETAFIVRLPALAAERQDAIAHLTG